MGFKLENPMTVKLKSQIRKFVGDQVKAGRFGSADEVVEEAVGRMIAESKVELDDQTIAAINRAEEQIDRGEGVGFDRFAANMRATVYPSPKSNLPQIRSQH
jgi:putative addiction module CopG family antidote